MEAFDEAIGGRMVGGGEVGFDVPRFQELLPQRRRELASSICCDRGWDAERCHQTMSERIHHRFRRDVGNWHSDWPARKAVDGRKQVAEPV